MKKILRKVLAGYGLFLICVLAVIMIVANTLAGTYSNLISTVLQQKTTKRVEVENVEEQDTEYFKSSYSKQSELYNAEIDYAKRVQSEGSVLLQNNGLPISKTGKITLLGSGIAKDAFLVCGGGSGSIDTSATPTLKEVFENDGYEVNPDMWDYYTSGAGKSTRGDSEVGEPVTSSIASASAYGDAAIVVIGRLGAEDADVALTTKEDASKHMLELSKNELDLIDLAISTFGKGKVTVLLNTLNAMEVGPLMTRDVSVVWICAGGQQGLRAIPGVLNGTYNPSGRLVDTYVYDNLSSPAMQNFGDYNYANYVKGDFGSEKYLVYQEGIYVGYRYYETRYEDKVLKQGNAGDYDYATAVAYPFGYGLSYTTFGYSNFRVDERDTEYRVYVDVKNTGGVDGKDVVEVYMQKPYTAGGVEVSSVELVGFTKTPEIKAGDTLSEVKITVPKEYMRVYDSNANDGKGGYVVQHGNYYVAIGTDAHVALNNILAKKGKSKAADGMTADGNSSLVYVSEINATLASALTSSYNVGADGEAIGNKIADADITVLDGSMKYLSRGDWTGTFPTSQTGRSASAALIEKMTDYYPNITDDGSTFSKPTTDAARSYGLVDMMGLDYDAKEWDKLLDQMSVEDMQKLIGNGAYGTPEIPSVSKDKTLDKDGPAGISATLIGGKGTFGFPVESLIAATWSKELAEEMGTFIGEDALLADVCGWYAPGLNIHRTAFSGRNFEYYSEDGYLSGVIGAKVIAAAQKMGLTTYAKHFAFNDEEKNRQSVCVFSSEQAGREIYLRGFEMAVRDGGSRGMMVSMNRLGGDWTGAHRGLTTGILKNEWGFTGCVVTDSSSIGNRQKGLYGGTDLWLGSGNFQGQSGWQDDNGVLTMMRNACHNILYVIANSNAMNGLTSGTIIVPIIPVWQGLLLAVDVIVYSACIAGTLAIIYFAFIPKKKKQSEEVSENE